jgi:hypothetical protein
MDSIFSFFRKLKIPKMILFILILFIYVGRLVLGRKKINHGQAPNLTDNIEGWILF